jgi:hypothetical protein
MDGFVGISHKYGISAVFDVGLFKFSDIFKMAAWEPFLSPVTFGKGDIVVILSVRACVRPSILSFGSSHELQGLKYFVI